MKKISDVKKFWLATVLYWVIFFILPTMFNYAFLKFLNNIFLKLNINIESAFLYYLLFIPLILVSIYRLVCNFKIKLVRVIFVVFYILVPYFIMVAIFFYGLSEMLRNFNPSF